MQWLNGISLVFLIGRFFGYFPWKMTHQLGLSAMRILGVKKCIF